MPANAAQQLRAKTRPFPKTIDGVEVMLRKPDVRWLVYTRTMPVPLLEKVGKLLQEWVGQDLSKVAEGASTENGKDALQLINFLTTVCMVSPKVVMTQEEWDALSEAEQENTLIVSELSVDFKEAVVIGTLYTSPEVKVEQQAAESFPDVGRSEGAAPDVQSIRTETVVGVGDQG